MSAEISWPVLAGTWIWFLVTGIMLGCCGFYLYCRYKTPQIDIENPIEGMVVPVVAIVREPLDHHEPDITRGLPRRVHHHHHVRETSV